MTRSRKRPLTLALSPLRWGEGTGVALALLLAMPVFAQTETVVGGVVGDSSVIAPVVTWNRIAPDGGTLSVSLNGWTISAEQTRRIAPRARRVVSIAFTPLNARSSNRVYVDGTRNRDLEFDDGSIEATYGRIWTAGERWTSDVRLVGLYEKVTGSADDEFWSSPFAGIRARQSYRDISAEDPLLMTFEGMEVSGEAEMFAGAHVWSRVRVQQRGSVRRGRIRIGERAVAFHGSSLNSVNAFLAGASWPLADVHPLYGYRYAELRLDRGVALTGDVSFALRDAIILAAHASALESRAIDARGVAVDVSVARKGVAVRIGVARGENRDLVVYGSILAAAFVR